MQAQGVHMGTRCVNHRGACCPCVSSFFSKKKLLSDAFPFHGGQTGHQMWPLRNYFSSFYLFELNVCRMVELCIPNNCMFFVFE